MAEGRIVAGGDLRVTIASDTDIVVARQEGRRLASRLEFSSSDLTVIAAAISEIARNVLEYAGTGEVTLRLVENRGHRGIAVEVCDHGPGIPDIALAVQDGYSTSGGLGLGLPGAKRLMDEFEVHSTPGQGTTVMMRKWER